MFSYKLTYTTFTGSYIPTKEFILSSYLPDFTMQNLAELFEHVSGDYIRVPEVDIRIGGATIYLGSSKKNLRVTLHDFEIAGHKAKKAQVSILPKTVLISGKLDCKIIPFGDVQLHDPELHILMESRYSVAGRRTDTTIRGNAKLENNPLTFPAAALLYVPPGSKNTEWTVMATLTDRDLPVLQLSKVVPQVAGNSLDLSLKDVIFVAASKDDPNTGHMIISHYKPFRRGKSLSLLQLRHGLKVKHRCTNLWRHREHSYSR
jgi:hypothetical protein